MGNKKLVGVLAAATVLCATAAWAMDARKDVLGINATTGENAPAGLALDSADSFVNPAFVLDYGNLLGLEGTAGVGDLFTGFFFADLTKIGLPGAVGVQVGRNYGGLKTAALTPAGNLNVLNNQLAPFLNHLNNTIDGDTLRDLTSVQSWGLLYALALQKNIQVGLAFNDIGNSLKGKGIVGVPASPDLSKSIGDLEFRLGTKIGLLANLSGALDVGVNLPTFGFSYSSAVLSQKANFAGFNLDVNLRLAYAVSKALDAVLLSGFAQYGGQTQIDPDTSITTDNLSSTLSRTDFFVGAGGLLHDQNSLAGIFLGFMTQSYANEQEFQNAQLNAKLDPAYTLFPSLKLLVEKSLASWIALRGSIGYTYQSASSSDLAAGTVYTTNAKGQSFIVTAMGTTITIDSILIEAVFSKKLLFGGPYLVGGVANTGLNTAVSVGYKF